MKRSMIRWFSIGLVLAFGLTACSTGAESTLAVEQAATLNSEVTSYPAQADLSGTIRVSGLLLYTR